MSINPNLCDRLQIHAPSNFKKSCFYYLGLHKKIFIPKLKDGRLHLAHVKLQNFSRILSAEERVKYRYPKMKVNIIILSVMPKVCGTDDDS
jgi:hypothetical protein